MFCITDTNGIDHLFSRDIVERIQIDPPDASNLCMVEVHLSGSFQQLLIDGGAREAVLDHLTE